MSTITSANGNRSSHKCSSIAFAPSRQFVELLQPDENNYLVLKPMHSAFFQSPLGRLLRHFGVSTFILSGLLTNSCILCTATMERCAIWTSMSPEDCCSARTRREHLQALQHIQTMVSGKIVPSQKINLASLKRGPASRTPKFNHHRYLTLRVVKLIGMSRICIRMA